MTLARWRRHVSSAPTWVLRWASSLAVGVTATAAAWLGSFGWPFAVLFGMAVLFLVLVLYELLGAHVDRVFVMFSRWEIGPSQIVITPRVEDGDLWFTVSNAGEDIQHLVELFLAMPRIWRRQQFTSDQWLIEQGGAFPRRLGLPSYLLPAAEEMQVRVSEKTRFLTEPHPMGWEWLVPEGWRGWCRLSVAYRCSAPTFVEWHDVFVSVGDGGWRSNCWSMRAVPPTGIDDRLPPDEAVPPWIMPRDEDGT